MPKHLTNQKQRTYRRRQVVFWCDERKEDDRTILETIDDLKEKRQFSRTVKTGIEIITALEAGDIEPLLNKYPMLRYALGNGSSGSPPPSGGSYPLPQPSIAGYLEQRTGGNLLRQMEAEYTAQGLKPVDDFDLELKQATRDENDNAAWNFKISSAAMVYGNYDHLSPEIIEYGIRTGKIPKDKAPQASPPKTAKPDGPKAMDVPQFDVPDDLGSGIELDF